MKSKEIYNIINEIAPYDTQMSFDNSGFLVGDKNAEVSKVLICLDITSPVVEEAKEKNCQLILSHHPIIFNPAKKVLAGTPLYNLAVSGISAICSHTNLDIGEIVGVNKSLAETLELVNFKKEDYSECVFSAELEYEMTAGEFSEYVKEKLSAPYTVFTRGTEDKIIKKIAFCSGSGGDFIFDSIGNCDAFLTGEAKHHELIFAWEQNFPMFVCGHYATEKIFDKYLKEYLESKCEGVEFILSENEEDPVEI